MITISNFFIGTMATFKGCSIPKRKPDFVSRRKKDRTRTGSEYWYGKDKKGTYIIRLSDHWVFRKSFDLSPKKRDIKIINTCVWNIKSVNVNTNRFLCGKCYLSDFTRI